MNKKVIRFELGRLLAVAASAFALNSCAARTDGYITPIASVTDVSGQPMITFDQSLIDYSLDPFTVLYVSELIPRVDGEFEFRPVWKLVQDKDKWKVPVKSLTYGTCPPGFQEISDPEPLIDGRFYLVGRSPNVFRKIDKARYEVRTLESLKNRTAM